MSEKSNITPLGYRILVVDDESSIRDVLQRTLMGAGFEVSTASSGHEALDAVAAIRPDAILLDLHMPGMGGLEVVQTLRQQKDRTPIFLLTSDHEAATIQKMVPSGIDDYLFKPFDLDYLVSYLKSYLQRLSSKQDS